MFRASHARRSSFGASSPKPRYGDTGLLQLTGHFVSASAAFTLARPPFRSHKTSCVWRVQAACFSTAAPRFAYDGNPKLRNFLS
jgi:hypothetical protein